MKIMYLRVYNLIILAVLTSPSENSLIYKTKFISSDLFSLKNLSEENAPVLNSGRVNLMLGGQILNDNEITFTFYVKRFQFENFDIAQFLYLRQNDSSAFPDYKLFTLTINLAQINQINYVPLKNSQSNNYPSGLELILEFKRALSTYELGIFVPIYDSYRKTFYNDIVDIQNHINDNNLKLASDLKMFLRLNSVKLSTELYNKLNDNDLILSTKQQLGNYDYYRKKHKGLKRVEKTNKEEILFSFLHYCEENAIKRKWSINCTNNIFKIKFKLLTECYDTKIVSQVEKKYNKDNFVEIIHASFYAKLNKLPYLTDTNFLNKLIAIDNIIIVDKIYQKFTEDERLIEQTQISLKGKKVKGNAIAVNQMEEFLKEKTNWMDNIKKTCLAIKADYLKVLSPDVTENHLAQIKTIENIKSDMLKFLLRFR
jgi:hypothetical protein